MRRVQQSRGHDDRGAAAVEFALVVPILLVVAFGIINFGFVLAQQISLSNGARQAARYAVVDGRDCSGLILEAQDGAGTIGMQGADVPTPVTTREGSPAPCPKPCAGSTAGDSITVTMTRSAAWVVPFPPLFTTSNAPTLTGTGVMRCEFS